MDKKPYADNLQYCQYFNCAWADRSLCSLCQTEKKRKKTDDLISMMMIIAMMTNND